MYSTGNGRMDEELVYLHQRELLKEAEHYRLVQQVSAARPRQQRGRLLQARAAAWLGGHFVNWGNALLAFSPGGQSRQQGC